MIQYNRSVSNSSTSSYVLLVSQEAFEIMKSEMDPMELAVAESLLETSSFMGHKCLCAQWSTGNYSTFEYMDTSPIFERAKEIAKERGEEFDEESTELWDGMDFDDVFRKNEKYKDHVFFTSEEF
jgi:hypothetical protein